MTRQLNSSLRLVLLLICLLPGATHVRAAINVLGYWHMGEEDTGAFAGGYCTNTVDSVANNTLTFVPTTNNQYAMYTSAVAATAASYTSSSLALSLTNGQYGTASLVTGASDNCGIECWVKPAVTNSGGEILAYNGLRGNGWGLFLTGNNFEVLYGGYRLWGAGAALAKAGVWTYLALVINNGTATLYTNGVPATTTTLTPLPPTSTFTVGGDAQYGEYYSGSIDEVRVFTFSPGTFVTNDLLYYQTAPPPAITLSSYIFNNSAVAGTDTVSIETSPGNPWTAVANAPWLHLQTTSGMGSNTIAFTFDDNPGAPRSGTLTIGGQTVTVKQAQATISFPLTFTGYYQCDFMETAATGGVYTVPITVTPNTGQWTCGANASWIHVLTPSGTGSTNIEFTVDPNTNSSATVRWDYNGIYFFSVGGSTSYNTKFLVYQQAPTPGPGQATYLFTGHLLPYLPEYTPVGASAAFHSIQSNDVFYLKMTLVTGAPVVYFATYACGVNNITFSVPSRGLFYTNSFEDFEVLDTAQNPYALRWIASGVDSTVDMTFWARDFSKTALASGSMPSPLNLTGFHPEAGNSATADNFAELFFYNAAASDATLWYADLVPVPNLNITPLSPGTNQIWWATSDATYTNKLQSASSLATGSTWQTVTNAPDVTGLTNSVALPDSGQAKFFRLKVP